MVRMIEGREEMLPSALVPSKRHRELIQTLV